MRFILILLVSLSLSNSYCQRQKLYLELNNQFIYHNESEKSFTHELQLKVKNEKTSDIDYFNFIINTDDKKSFDENGTLILDPKVLTIEELKNKSFCEIHDLLSSRTIYFVKKNENGKYKCWISMYLGTYRNLVISKPGKI